MTTYGVTADGLVPKTFEVIQGEIVSRLRARFGPSLKLSDDSLFGEIVNIQSEREALLWELLEAVVSSDDPDAATQTLLDALCALTGTVREPAIASAVVLTLTGTPLTVVTEGSRASVEEAGDEFVTTADATIEELDAWAPTTAYVIDDRVTNAGKAYISTVAGTSAGSGGPTTTGEAIVDGTATWRFMGEGMGAADAVAQAAETGPTVALSGTITVIETPVSGWDSVINLLDAEVGSLVETDEDLRVRREQELAGAGTSPAPALLAALLRVDGVFAVKLFVNNTSVTDSDGVPPHSVEALVQGGADQDIWDALLANVSAGIGTFGTESGTAEDSEGTDYTVAFSRPEEIEIYVDITLEKDPDTYPIDGDDMVKAAIVAYGDAQSPGRDVVASAISAQAFKVTGVLDVSEVLIDDAPAPGASTTITITTRQLAVYDTSRITVTSSDGTP